ncbi:MAG: hypothetical protein K6G90_05740 [Clostridia bacterium]|nr:hypothetical protein [Clostridia bacterium]
MSRYLVRFTPSGEYFFGNEKRLSYGKNDNSENITYFISGENSPLQTTLFGALRYLLLPEKSFETAGNSASLIGRKPFIIDSGTVQDFGAIRSMSPVFLAKDDEWFIPTPYDHNRSSDSGVYTPLSDYRKMTTADGEKLYTEQYDSKKGIESSCMSLCDGHIERDVFSSSVQIGINRRSDNDGLFKKEYKLLNSGFSFAVIADIDAAPELSNQAVLLGQGKSPFSVNMALYTGESLENKAGSIITQARQRVGVEPDDFVYFASDFFTDSRLEDIYSRFQFAAVATRDFRSFAVLDSGHVQRGDCLHRFIKAGSIAIPTDRFDYEPSGKQRNAATIGFNSIILKGVIK